MLGSDVTPLIFAISNNEVDIVRLLLEWGGVDIHVKSGGLGARAHAMYNKVISDLLKAKGAKIRGTVDKRGRMTVT